MLKLFLYIFVFGTIFMITGCAMKAHTPETGDKSIEGTNLREVINARVAIAYLDPTIDFKRYSKVLVKPLNFDCMEIIQPQKSYRGTSSNIFELNDRDKEQIDKRFHDAMVNTLQKQAGFEIVENAGDDVLILSVMILKIKPNAPKDDMMSRSSSSTIYTDGAGSISIGAQLADSISGRQIAILADVKDSSNMWGENNRVSNMGDVSNMFSSWGMQFASALKGLQQ